MFNFNVNVLYCAIDFKITSSTQGSTCVEHGVLYKPVLNVYLTSFLLFTRIFFFLSFWWPWKGPIGIEIRVRHSPSNETGNLTSETVEGAALSFQGVDDVHGGDRLSSLLVPCRWRRHGSRSREHLENTASFLVDETRDALDTATTGKTTDGRLLFK